MNFPHGSTVKKLPGNTRDTGFIPGPGRFPGGGNGNPLHYSFLENSTDRSLAGYKSMESQRVSRLSKHTHTHFIQLFSPGNTALLINNIMLYTFCNLRGFRCKNHRNLWHFDGMSLVGKGEFVWIMNPPSRSSTHGPEGHITDLIVQTSH